MTFCWFFVSTRQVLSGTGSAKEILQCLCVFDRKQNDIDPYGICQMENVFVNRWELIIMHDCFTNDTDSVVAKYLSNARICYLKKEKTAELLSRKIILYKKRIVNGLIFIY